MIDDSIHQWLEAAYPLGFKLHTAAEAYEIFARKTIAEAFPSWRVELRVILLESPGRFSCAAPEKDLIVLDNRQIRLFTIQDWLFRQPDVPEAASLTLAALTLAAAMRGHFNLTDRTFLCTQMWRERAEALRDLTRTALAHKGHSALSAFLLLHEAAHIALEQSEPFTQSIVERVTGALRAHRSTNVDLLERLKSGQIYDDPRVTVEGDPDRLIADLEAHIRFIDSSGEEIVRESSCDVLAAKGFLNWRSGGDFLNTKPSPNALTPQDIGDLIVLCLRCSRLLAVQSATAEMANHLATSEDRPEIGDAFSQMQARSNVVIDVLRQLFDEALTHCGIDGSNLAGETSNLNRDIENLAHRTAEYLLSPVEHLASYFEQNELYIKDFEKSTKAAFADHKPSLVELLMSVDKINREFLI